ncbi:MAG: leucyl/phenylalanyl-tRNA--protein transferase [Rhizobiales bacterium]|nr:leucyl/phenylalanyl-tRNA--protein transferase [Hyphomicrobiales bacterium]
MTTITPQILLKAYASGVFPMAESADDNALYWIEPEFRGLIPLDGFKVSRSLRKACRRQMFEVRVDTAFADVIERCAERAPDRKTTWINDRILALYNQLFKMGFCHSVECWQDDELVGGLYGVRIGAAFFGESMFTRRRDASKVALVHLVARLRFGCFKLLDAQFINDHLKQFGALELPRAEYHQLLEDALGKDADFQAFDGDRDPERVLELALAP